MSRYIFSSVQDYVDAILEEEVDNMENVLRVDFWRNTIMHHRCRPLLKEFVAEYLVQFVGNEILITAILNSCDWNDIYDNIKKYMEDNYEELLATI